jgi:hypothetical protein
MNKAEDSRDHRCNLLEKESLDHTYQTWTGSMGRLDYLIDPDKIKDRDAQKPC